jgi:hypothetical protein
MLYCNNNHNNSLLRPVGVRGRFGGARGWGGGVGGVEVYAMGAVVDMFFLCFSSRTLPSSTCSLCCCACGSRRAKNVASRVCHCHVILSLPPTRAGT